MAKKQTKRRSMVKQPTTALGGGVSLAGIVPLFPPDWQPYVGVAATLLGVLAPLLAARAQRQED